MSRRATAALITLQVAIVGLLIAVVVVLTEQTREWQQLERELREELGGLDRYVDMGVRLVVVRKDEKYGRELVPGKPPLIELGETHFGGMVDTLTCTFVSASENPVTWYVGEEAFPIVVHDDSMPRRILLYGSEGSGKTVVLVQWSGLRCLEATGLPLTLGLTAPSGPRMMNPRGALERHWPAAWWRFSERHQLYRLANGVHVQLKSTHKARKDEGAQVQGQNWGAGAASDEIQDSVDADPDIEMRLRDAPYGRLGKRLATATAKSSSKWRDWRDGALSSPGWGKRVLYGPKQPFVDDAFWKGVVLTDRERRRRQGAEDIGPEHQLYHCWARVDADGNPGNLRPLPQLGIEDMSSEVLSTRTALYSALVGHDPGRRTRASYVIKPYRMPRIGRTWWVLDEIVGEGNTIEQHIAELLASLRGRWGCNRLDYKGRIIEDAPRALVYADPYTDSAAGDRHPDRSVYTKFRNAGLDIFPAAVKAVEGGTRPAQIPREARIDMINTLLCDSDRVRRLYVATREDGQPCAPRLVAAFESMERDAAGHAETERKGEGDQSHYGAALGYGLWRFEKAISKRPPRARTA